MSDTERTTPASDDATPPELGTIDYLDWAKQQLPERCPRWCVNTHMQALEEGCRIELAREHQAADFSVPQVFRRDMRGPSLRIEMTQDAPLSAFVSPVITVEMTQKTEQGHYEHHQARLSPSEARTMSAMLKHYADEAELHYW